MKKLHYFLILSIILVFSNGCSMVVKLPKNNYTQKITIDNFKTKFKPYPDNAVPYQNILNKDIAQAEVGDTNLYGITITQDLKDTYDGYLSGDGEKALIALQHINQTSKDEKMLWQSSFLKVQVLIMMGLGDDALEEISTCQEHERKSFNSNLNCTALRGELNVWLENYDKAKNDADSVLLSIGDWEFPTSYERPPANMDKLVAVTTAQMRAYTTLAALYNLTNDYKNSYYYANEAEKRMNAVHYVSNHWLYGKFVHLHLDSYYGRATNLTFLATSELALGMNKKKVNKDFKQAIDFFNMINYKKGVATVLALKARVYNQTGQHNLCYSAGKEAIEYALKYGFLDFVWRVEVLRGETLLNHGLRDEAKESYRRADETINVLSGALSSDSSKTRFGVGKDDIAYNLIKFDIEDKNYTQLFSDLEKNRARAFVDMLSSRFITLGQDNRLLKEVAALDKKIRKQHLLNSSNPTAQSTALLNNLLKQRETKVKMLQIQNPKLASAVSIWSSSLQKTQDSLQQEESIVYFLPLKDDDKITYLKIKKTGVSLKELSISMKDLKENLAQLSEILGIDTLFSTRGLKLKEASFVSSKNTDKTKLENFIQLFGNKLSLKDIFGAEKTYIVASKITNFIPWAMLDSSHQYSLLPNASWINYKDIKLSPKKEIIIVANPNFGGDLPQLLGAAQEGKDIAKLYNTQVLSDDNATLKNLTSQIQGGVDILHLATHSIFDKENPLNSAIYLTKDKKAFALSAKDIFISPIHSNLVVLSSCESGLGKSVNGDDMLGLSRSFFLGGTKSVLSSLWEIDDIGTKEFMDTFYKYTKDKNYSYAYQKAREILKEKGYSPSIYGAFILNGTN